MEHRKCGQTPNPQEQFVLCWSRWGRRYSGFEFKRDVLDLERPSLAYRYPEFILPCETLGLNEGKPFRECPVYLWLLVTITVVDLSTEKMVIVEIRLWMCSAFQTIDEAIRIGDLDTERGFETLSQLGRKLIAGAKDEYVVLFG